MTRTEVSSVRFVGETNSPLPAQSWVPWLIVGLMTVAFAATFGWLSVARHLAYQSHAFDLGNMSQAVWNTLHGHPLRFTDMAVGNQVLKNRLAIHVEPILLLLAPLYLLHSGPETLLVTQAIVVALGAIPAYLLALQVLDSRWIALVLPAAYLMHPSLQNAVLDDFHAVTLSACLLLWALYFAWSGVIPAFAVAAVLAMATKEDIGLLIAVLGVLLLTRRRWWAGALAVVGGVGWFLVCVEVIIPAFNPAGHSPYLARYGYLGHGIAGIVLAAMTRPETVIHVLTSQARLAFLADLLAPLGFVSLLGLPILVLAFPSFLTDMLSTDPHMYSGFYQYSAELVPYVIGSAAIGVAAAAHWARDHRVASVQALPRALLGVVLAASVVATRLYGFSPLAYGYVIPSAGSHQAEEDRLLRLIPPQAVVAAADEIEPHVSDRYTVYMLPTLRPSNLPAARYLVLDASIPALPITPASLHRVAARALRRGYGVVAANDGILLLRQGLASKRLPRAFYGFVYTQPVGGIHRFGAWGPLRLTGTVVHPQALLVDRARPAIEVETYWRTTRHLPRSARIVFWLSPVYLGRHPRFSSSWTEDADSPTWDWLPLARWPVGRTIHAASLPLVPDTLQRGQVDVAVSVTGAGRILIPPGQRVSGTALLRLATVKVGY